ncbi:ribonuclease H-like domain-containing protein [Tanacetum coccineum]
MQHENQSYKDSKGTHISSCLGCSCTHYLLSTFLITVDVPEIYMHQFWFTIDKKDSTSYRFKINKKRNRIDMEVFREILQICLRLPNQEFDVLPLDEEIVSFIKELGHKGDIKSIIEVVVDQMYQPWRTFASIINKCLSRKSQDDSILGPMRFVSKADDYQVYRVLIPEVMTNQKMQASPNYKTYLALATGAATPKKALKFTKPASPSKKKTLAIVEEPELAKKVVPSKKPSRKQSTGVQILNTPGVSVSKKKASATTDKRKGINLLSEAALLEEARVKKVLKRSQRETTIHQACGSGDGVGFQLEKEECDIWAMEMEHYLEYIDNDVWKVIQNGNSKKRISTGKDGVVRVLPPVSAIEIHVIEKERKARTMLLMAIPKEHLRRFHEIDDAKEIWEAIRTRFGGNVNSKKIQKAVLKQQFEAFTISSSEGLEKGYDRFQQLLSQLEAHGAEVSTEDANHKFLRSLPPAWSNLAITMRTKPDVDTLSIDDLYNNLRVFEQELTSTSKSSASAQNVAFVSHSKSSTNKVKSGHTGAYSTYTPSTSSNNIPEREVPAGFANEVIYSLFAKQSKDLDLLHEDLEQIDDMDIEEMDINWQITMIAIRMKKFYKKTRRRVRIDGNKPVGFDKKKLECFKCHNTGHFARECPSKGTNDGKKRDSFYQDQGAGKKEQNQNCLLTMDDGVVNWGEHTEEEVETNHALMAISLNNEVSLFDSGMSSTSKVGLGYEIKSNDEVLSYEEEMNRTVFNCTEEDFIDKPLCSRFSKTNSNKGVPHHLTGDYTPKPQQEIDESLYVYGKKGPQKPETSVSDDTFSENSVTTNEKVVSE